MIAEPFASVAKLADTPDLFILYPENEALKQGKLPPTRRFVAEWIGLALPTAMALLMIAIVLNDVLVRVQLLTVGKTTDGVVVDVEARGLVRVEGTTTNRPSRYLITYEYTVGDHTQRRSHSVPELEYPFLNVGDPVTVRYLDWYPSISQISAPLELGGMQGSDAAFILVFAALLLGMMYVGYRVLRARRQLDQAGFLLGRITGVVQGGTSARPRLEFLFEFVNPQGELIMGKQPLSRRHYTLFREVTTITMPIAIRYVSDRLYRLV